MGQGYIIEFLEREFYKDPENNKFKKKEIEEGIGKKVKNRSLISLVKYGEIKRELETLKSSKGFVYRQYVYSYVPNGPFKITDFRKR